MPSYNMIIDFFRRYSIPLCSCYLSLGNETLGGVEGGIGHMSLSPHQVALLWLCSAHRIVTFKVDITSKFNYDNLNIEKLLSKLIPFIKLLLLNLHGSKVLKIFLIFSVTLCSGQYQYYDDDDQVKNICPLSRFH